jgi:3-oxoacyl-[acyl-carrier-protein] synthase II
VRAGETGTGDRHRRVVVTGIGCVSPLGLGFESSWQNAVAGRSGVAELGGSELGSEDAQQLPVRIAARIREPLPLDDVPPKERRRIDRVCQLAWVAARESLADAELGPGSADPDRVGVSIGSAIGGIGTILENHRALLAGGPRRVSPFLVPMSIANLPSGFVAIRRGLRGPNLCQATACATGAHAIGEAARTVASGAADAMLAGGSEAAINPLVMAGFSNMQALSRHRGDPARASRPFDQERDGFVIGEGAGVLVLEALDHALARGARIRAEVLGYGAGADAVHVAQPDLEGHGAERCMRLALADAGVGPGALDWINAHATSTPTGDRAEARAIQRLLGDHAPHGPVSATKSMTGHLLGAAGALEALFCVRALETGWLPPTINLDRADPECQLDHVGHKAREVEARIVLSNSFGFGGTNASLVFARGLEP